MTECPGEGGRGEATQEASSSPSSAAKSVQFQLSREDAVKNDINNDDDDDDDNQSIADGIQEVTAFFTPILDHARDHLRHRFDSCRRFRRR